MNKYEKAFKEITRFHSEKAHQQTSHSLLKELVERATPKKVIKKWETDYRCPICNEMIVEHVAKVKYCEDCGQALDWTDNNA